MNPILSLVLSLLAIAISGTCGVLVALFVVREVGLTGVLAAIAAVMIGVLAATAIWIGGVALLRSLRWMK